ncbi:chorion peroxidase-like [Ylistrum balloti]|uniref:chorion peroxidase-like n=1 Tax=Ylistrum balloti TaxID=509963 RepID=UPI002905BA67|nr:chorion peroxidase-like [Ylistrum balloti]
MLYIKAALIVAVICCFNDISSARVASKVKLDVLEQDLIEVIVRYARDKGEQAVNEKKQQKKNFFETGVDKHNKGNSVRQLHQMKMSTPETREKEEYAVRSLAAVEELQRLTGLTLEEIQGSEKVVTEWRKNIPCASKLQPSECKSMSQRYRTINGTCNNLQHPDWGSAGISQRRYLPAKYQNGIGSPRNESRNLLLPSARLVSNTVFADASTPKLDGKLSLMVMAWGQFLDHDITLTPTASGEEGTQIDCCASTGSGRYGIHVQESPRDDCFPIDIPSNDNHFKTQCMSFVRSLPAADSCDPARREQANAITAFVDGSNVYGSSTAEVASLRAFTKGLLLSSPGNLPPNGSDDSCIISEPGDFCMRTGDVRANVVPHLGANHVLFFREHNRIAQELSTLNPTWDDQQTFEETRKIVSALLQQITYYEWLPSILAPEFLTSYNLTRSEGDPYNSSVDPSIKNSFAVAAMRHGHSQVSGFQAFLLHDYMTYKVKSIQDTFLKPTMVVGNAGNDVPQLARWICSNESMKRDRILEPGVRDLLFLDSNGHSFDLGALNIQRGRDHGIPSYTKWREWIGAPKATSFKQLTDHSKREKRLLEKVYDHVDDIDLFAGGISENDVKGGHLGRVFSHILARQFSELKAGDRFFYERPTKEGFSKRQLDEIRKVKLSKVMCENFGLDLIPENVFKMLSNGKTLKTCDSLPGMDLSKWIPKSNRDEDGGKSN